MTDEPQRRVVLATIVLLALVALAAVAFASPVAADPHGNGSSAYAITQEQCNDVSPVVNENQPVEEFYDYRWNGSDADYSSYGTKEYQEDNTSTLLLYRGSDGTSLVVVHERHHDDASEGTRGGFATFDVTGIDPGDGWAVEDDDYPDQDDNFEHTEDGSEMVWGWGQGRTDGGAYRGLEGEFEIGIDPTFNDASDHFVDPDNSDSYDGMVHDWEVVTANESGVERVGLDNLEDQVTIEPGYCTPPEAELTTSNATPTIGQDVTLNASGSSSAADVTQYQWDLTGDGNVDQTTNDPVLTHAFESADERDVTVTVDDGYDSDDTSVSVDVVDETPPTARIDAPGEVSATEQFELSGNASEDNADIDSYEWTFHDGTTDSGERVTHTYANPGDHEVQLTVTDPSGNQDSTNATITATEAPDPVASLEVPDEATVDETVTFDADNSTARGNTTYEWSIDGDVVNTTTEPTYEHTFSTGGTHDVRVNVTDDHGANTDETTIEVLGLPIADIDANRTTAETGEALSFDGSNSEGNVTSYDWNFGDGTSVDDGGPTTTHTFNASGAYDVELTVEGDDGDTDTDSVPVEIEEPDEPSSPNADLAVPEEATVGEPTLLDASGSEVGADATYDWIVDGDSVETTTEATYEHTFSSEGDYDVAVNVTNGDGVSDTAETTVSVANDSSGGNGSDGGDGSGGDGSGGDGSDGSDGSGGDGAGDGDDGGSSGGDSGSSGGYGGGGGGGYSPPPSDDDPVETAVQVTDGALVVSAENAEAGESFTVDVPQNASIGADADRDALDLRSLTVTPGEDTDAANVTVAPADRDVPGRFTATSAFEPDADLEVESIEYDVAVDREAMDAAGVSAADLTAYARADAWDPLETSAETADGRILASATVDGDAPVGIGAVGPVLFVDDVATDGPTVDGQASLATTVENTGSDPGEWTLPVNVSGEPVDEQPIALDAGEERTISTAVPASDVAEGGIDVAGLRHELAVAAVTGLSVTPTEPAPNETATVEVAVVNRGAAGEVAVDLRRDGETVATELLTLDAGEETTVTVEQEFASEGTYEFAAGNATESVSVAERDSFDGQESEVTSDATPGFGTLASVGALLAVVVLAAVLVARRRDRR